MKFIELLTYSFIITATITGLCEIFEDIKMSKWTVGFMIPYKEGEKFEAIIRHCNENLKLKDKKVFLEAGEDCVYYDGSKMSWNWSIVMHRPVKKKKAKK